MKECGNKSTYITILGGGIAGIGVGYYAKKNGLPFRIYEANNQIGGNCITLEHKGFFFDSGAHRFHDRDTEITKEVKELFGEELKKINIPTQIYHKGEFIDFPLSPLNLMKKLGLPTFAKAATEVVSSRWRVKKPNANFEDFALNNYGNILANRFLLNYSKKLWGRPCSNLSIDIAGKRMAGLNLRTFFTEAIFRQKTKTGHLEGPFYYPKTGIGAITEKLGGLCGEENILRNSKITKIFHSHARIQAVEVNMRKRIDIDEVVSTLPLNLFLQMMEPRPPEEILSFAQNLHYRNIILVALFLNKESVTGSATVYFPDPDYPFTRIYEPKNRSAYMSPPGKTSLVAEIPCQPEDKFWNMQDDALIQLIRSQLIQLGWVKREEVIDALVSRLSYAYPILEIGVEEKIQKIFNFLKSFNNLKISGRNGKFVYAWVHNMMRFGKEIIGDYITSGKR